MGAVLVAAAVLAPVAALMVAASGGSADLWSHLIQYVLPGALRDTAVLLAGVGVLTATVGAGTAWLTTAYDFPGRRAAEWALLLPLAVPTYIVAYAYLDLLHPVGPVQSALRALLGFENPRDFRLPDIRSMAGCTVLLAAVLYPYVYLMTRAMLVAQSAACFEAARTLGVSRRALFWRVALPMARPAIAVGVSLALLEALNDIGAAEFLGVRTLTVSIYTTWVTRSDLAGAAQMALAMLAVVVGLVAVERRARRGRRYENDARQARPAAATVLVGWRAVLAATAAALPVLVGFVVPAAYLAAATIDRLREAPVSPSLVDETVATLGFAAAVTVVTTVLGGLVAYAHRVRPGRLAAFAARASALGYALPGTVLAIGILPVLMVVDAAIERLGGVFGITWTLFSLGTGAGVIYACVTRFLAVAVGGVEAGLGRISGSVDDAARTMGASAMRRLWRLHLPLARPAVVTAAMLVFVDAMKELPATLLLRPIGVETLATHLYGEAARGTYEDGAIAALLIVAAGLLPVIALARLSRSGAAGAGDWAVDPVSSASAGSANDRS